MPARPRWTRCWRPTVTTASPCSPSSRSESRPARRAVACAFMGLATLAKGPLGCCCLPSWWAAMRCIGRDGRFARAVRSPLGLLLFLLVAGPWHVAILRDPGLAVRRGVPAEPQRRSVHLDDPQPPGAALLLRARDPAWACFRGRACSAGPGRPAAEPLADRPVPAPLGSCCRSSSSRWRARSCPATFLPCCPPWPCSWAGRPPPDRGGGGGGMVGGPRAVSLVGLVLGALLVAHARLSAPPLRGAGLGAGRPLRIVVRDRGPGLLVAGRGRPRGRPCASCGSADRAPSCS